MLVQAEGPGPIPFKLLEAQFRSAGLPIPAVAILGAVTIGVEALKGPVLVEAIIAVSLTSGDEQGGLKTAGKIVPGQAQAAERAVEGILPRRIGEAAPAVIEGEAVVTVVQF